ncbi:MAG: hypothetical protein ACRDRN_08415 [Sciscionella sp.]
MISETAPVPNRRVERTGKPEAAEQAALSQWIPIADEVGPTGC